MTRQQQNEIIINSIGEQLKDMPDVQERIAQSFTQWFQNLVKQGVELMRPEPVATAQQQQPQTSPQPQTPTTS
jgi:hypothetical protein